MQFVLFFITACVLVMVSVEDFKSRTVRVIWFPVVLALSVVYSYKNIAMDDLISNVLISFSFLILQGTFLMGYLIVKHKGWINITREYLGWGDILFLLVIMPFFSPSVYVLFFLSSLLFTILFVIMYRWIRHAEMKFIPLAGIQAICLVGILIFHQFISPVLFHDFLSSLAI